MTHVPPASGLSRARRMKEARYGTHPGGRVGDAAGPAIRLIGSGLLAGCLLAATARAVYALPTQPATPSVVQVAPGVVAPSTDVDPGMATSPPEEAAGGTVIAPPGTPGSRSAVEPK